MFAHNCNKMSKKQVRWPFFKELLNYKCLQMKFYMDRLANCSHVGILVFCIHLFYSKHPKGFRRTLICMPDSRVIDILLRYISYAY